MAAFYTKSAYREGSANPGQGDGGGLINTTKIGPAVFVNLTGDLAWGGRVEGGSPRGECSERNSLGGGRRRCRRG